jgi:hypothetical protein
MEKAKFRKGSPASRNLQFQEDLKWNYNPNFINPLLEICNFENR